MKMDWRLRVNYLRLKYITPKIGDSEVFLLMRKFLITNGNSDKIAKYVDKLNIKKYAKEWGVETPNVLFTFNEKGEITSGEIPKDKVVFIKHNNGGGSHFVAKNIDSNTITKEYLAKLWKKMDKKALRFWLKNCEPQYRNIKSAMFAEEKVGDKILEYKVNVFNNWGYITVVDFQDKKEREYTIDFEYNRMPNSDNSGKKWIGVPQLDHKFLDTIVELSKKVQKSIGCYVRVDFYDVNSKPLLGEVTFTNNAGFNYKFEGDKNLVKKWKQEYKETNQEWM